LNPIQSNLEVPPVSSDENKARPTCVDCRVVSPDTDTNYTLISARHGWRSIVVTDPTGRRAMEWRCPNCWVRYKAEAGR
jgi:hypothetical protein